MGQTTQLMSKRGGQPAQEPVPWEYFLETYLSDGSAWFNYEDHEYTIQVFDDGWNILDESESGDGLPVFTGPSDMNEFTETPIPLLANRSLHEAWPDIIFDGA